MNRLAVLIPASLAAVVLTFAAAPAGACAAGPDGPCLEDPTSRSSRASGGSTGISNSTRDESERRWQGAPLVWADLDHDGQLDAGEPHETR